jgi:hypothetical protein
MKTYHPLDSIPAGAATWLTFGALAVLFLIFGRLAGPNLDAPGVTHHRIRALEQPADAKDAHAVIAEWEKAGRLDAVRGSILWDNFFIPVYTTLIALACVIAARAFFQQGSTAYSIALLLAWLPWLAGVLDYGENCAMLRMLDGFEGEALPRVARWCATVKFSLALPLGARGVRGALDAGVRALWPR